METAEGGPRPILLPRPPAPNHPCPSVLICGFNLFFHFSPFICGTIPLNARPINSLHAPAPGCAAQFPRFPRNPAAHSPACSAAHR